MLLLTGREVLHRDLYRGLVVWNRTKKRDKWGAAKRTSRPRGEWTEVQVEDLRIYDKVRLGAETPKAPS